MISSATLFQLQADEGQHCRDQAFAEAIKWIMFWEKGATNGEIKP
jgi:hypothetical protein